MCDCQDGFEGDQCEISEKIIMPLYLYMRLLLLDIDECASRPCQNGANCVDLVNAFECECEDGFTGDLCEVGKKKFNKSITSDQW